MPPAEFVERYYTVARRQNLLEVFDDVPVVPRQACSLVVDYRHQVREGSLRAQLHLAHDRAMPWD